MTDLLALADRIAAATGPSLDLDLDILNALDGGGWERGGFAPRSVRRHHSDGISGSILCPAYTASLNTITAAIRERVYSWEARQSATGDPGQGAVWNPNKQPSDNNHTRINGRSSPALALCEALIRAMAGEASNG